MVWRTTKYDDWERDGEKRGGERERRKERETDKKVLNTSIEILPPKKSKYNEQIYELSSVPLPQLCITTNQVKNTRNEWPQLNERKTVNKLFFAIIFCCVWLVLYPTPCHLPSHSLSLSSQKCIQFFFLERKNRHNVNCRAFFGVRFEKRQKNKESEWQWKKSRFFHVDLWYGRMVDAYRWKYVNGFIQWYALLCVCVVCCA